MVTPTPNFLQCLRQEFKWRAIKHVTKCLEVTSQAFRLFNKMCQLFCLNKHNFIFTIWYWKKARSVFPTFTHAPLNTTLLTPDVCGVFPCRPTSSPVDTSWVLYNSIQFLTLFVDNVKSQRLGAQFHKTALASDVNCKYNWPSISQVPRLRVQSTRGQKY